MAGQSIPDNRYDAKPDDNFRQHHLVERDSRDCEAGCIRRMRMTDAHYVGPVPVYLQMEVGFRRGLLAALQQFAAHIYDNEIFRFHEAFAGTGRRNENRSIVETRAHIPVVRGSVASVVYSPADFDQLFSQQLNILFHHLAPISFRILMSSLLEIQSFTSRYLAGSSNSPKSASVGFSLDLSITRRTRSVVTGLNRRSLLNPTVVPFVSSCQPVPSR